MPKSDIPPFMIYLEKMGEAERKLKMRDKYQGWCTAAIIFFALVIAAGLAAGLSKIDPLGKATYQIHEINTGIEAGSEGN